MFPRQHATATVRPFGSGFAVRYPTADAATMAQVRQYQEELRASHPGWLSRVEFDRSRNQISLFVFHLSELPAAVFSRQGYRQGYPA